MVPRSARPTLLWQGRPVASCCVQRDCVQRELAPLCSLGLGSRQMPCIPSSCSCAPPVWTQARFQFHCLKRELLAHARFAGAVHTPLALGRQGPPGLWSWGLSPNSCIVCAVKGIHPPKTPRRWCNTEAENQVRSVLFGLAACGS